MRACSSSLLALLSTAALASDPVESRLTALSLDGDDVRFELFRGWEGTSVLVKVLQRKRGKDGAEEWPKVGVFKTTSANTYAPGEVGTYRLGHYLGVELFPVTVPASLGPAGIKKLAALLATASFKNRMKDKARRAVLAELDAHLAAGQRFPGALKEWVTGFQVLRAPKMALPEELRAFEWLDRAGPQPPDEPAVYAIDDVLYQEHGRYTAKTTFREFARDLSDLLVVDAVAGQHDRWAGGNLCFRLRSGAPFRKTGPKRFEGDAARLFALDNGASFRHAGTGLRHLERATRFQRKVYERLLALRARIAKDPAEVQRWLTVDDRGLKVVRRALPRVIAWIESSAAKGNGAWFAGK